MATSGDSAPFDLTTLHAHPFQRTPENPRALTAVARFLRLQCSGFSRPHGLGSFCFRYVSATDNPFRAIIGRSRVFVRRAFVTKVSGLRTHARTRDACERIWRHTSLPTLDTFQCRARSLIPRSKVPVHRVRFAPYKPRLHTDSRTLFRSMVRSVAHEGNPSPSDPFRAVASRTLRASTARHPRLRSLSRGKVRCVREGSYCVERASVTR